MRKLGPILGALAVALPSAGYAQGAPHYAIEGAEPGTEMAGAAGAVNGGVVVRERAGLLSVDRWPRLYVIHHHYVSNHYDRTVTVGDVLPGPAEYYDIPPEFGVRGSYRYAVVKDRTVIVNPAHASWCRLSTNTKSRRITPSVEKWRR
jgi:Protein of unknown function (DUF1236)